MILFIDACVREQSRTRRLAEHLLMKLREPVTRLKLSEQPLSMTDQAFLALRDRLSANGEFQHPIFAMARQFAASETIVIAAPYWDLSFPAALKQYFERVNAVGVTFSYSKDGIPVGLCCARQLYYVTTAGGMLVSEEFGYGYIKALAEQFYQIPEIKLIKAEGLDLPGADVEAIMERAERDLDSMLEAAAPQ